MPPIHQIPKGHTIDDLVEPMVSEVLGNYSEPYCLGGWCRYGMLAYKVAGRLRMRGKRVTTVVLFDAPSLGSARAAAKRRKRKVVAIESNTTN